MALELVDDFEPCSKDDCWLATGLCPSCSRNAGLLNAARAACNVRASMSASEKILPLHVTSLKRDLAAAVAYLEIERNNRLDEASRRMRAAESRDRWRKVAVQLTADLEDP